MGIFDMFKKPAEPEVPSRVDPKIDLENAQGAKVGNPDVAEISRWSKFVGGVRKVTSDAKLKILGVDQEAIKAKQDRVERNKFFMASQHAPEIELAKLYKNSEPKPTQIDGESEMTLDQIYTASGNKNKPTSVKKSLQSPGYSVEDVKTQVKRGLLQDEYSKLSLDELDQSLALKEVEEKSVLFNKMDPAIYPTEKDRKELANKKKIELEEIRAEIKRRNVPEIAVQPEIQVVNTDAVKPKAVQAADVKVINTESAQAQKPVSTNSKNENFVADSVKLEMQRREAVSLIRNTYGKSLPAIIEKAINMRQRSLGSGAEDTTKKDEIRIAKIEIEELNKILAEIPVLTEKITPESKKEKLNALMAKWTPKINSNFEKGKAFGLKALDKYRALPPETKIALGATFACVSLLSGGTTSVVTKSIGIASAARGVYESEQESINKLGREMTTKEKRGALLKSAIIGALIGVAGENHGEILEKISSLIPEGFKDFTSEQFAKVADINPFREIPKAISTDAILQNDTAPIEPSVASAPMSTEVVPESGPTLQSVEGENILNEYTVQSEDSLESILLDRGFEGYGEIDEETKLKKIYNMFSSAEGKELLAEQGITNINDIKAGKVLDLDSFMDLLNKK